jgi:hypothetical protein
MSKVMKRWQDENPDAGHYACLAGFEKAICAYTDKLEYAYQGLEITEQIDLFGFVTTLLEKEREGE